VGLPHNVERVAIFDPATDWLTFEAAAEFSGGYRHGYGTSVAIGSKVVGLPRNVGKIAIFDMAPDMVTFKEAAEVAGNWLYFTSVAIGSKAVGPPYNGERVAIIDTATDSLTFKEAAELAGSGCSNEFDVGIGIKGGGGAAMQCREGADLNAATDMLTFKEAAEFTDEPTTSLRAKWPWLCVVLVSSSLQSSLSRRSQRGLRFNADKMADL